MNLCIDEGNSRTKLAIFDNCNIILELELTNELLSTLDKLCKTHQIKNCILSTVKAAARKEMIDFFSDKNINFTELTSNTTLPIMNCYQTPDTLGKDRLAAIIGAHTLQPKNNILVIDAGTAITFDFINSKAEYLGGCISPGLQMRLNALHEQTKRLPQVDKEGSINLIGKNTTEAIRSGVVNGMLFEIEGYITHLKSIHSNLLTFLTGGDCFYFEGKLKNSIFANKNLVLIGLNSILNHNA